MGYSEVVNRRTDNTLGKGKKDKSNNNKLESTTQKTKNRSTPEKNQTTQWPKEIVQKDKQRPTKHTHKTKDRVTRTPLKVGGELRCSGRVSSSCSTSDTCRVNLITNLVISHEWEKDRELFTTLMYNHTSKCYHIAKKTTLFVCEIQQLWSNFLIIKTHLHKT